MRQQRTSTYGLKADVRPDPPLQVGDRLAEWFALSKDRNVDLTRERPTLHSSVAEGRWRFGVTIGAKGWKNEQERAFDAALGGRIRRLRELAGISQTALASMAGVSFQQMGKYENGLDRIAASRLATIAVALDVPASLLMGGEVQSLHQARSHIRTEKLAVLFGRCDPGGQHTLIALAETLAAK